MTKVSKEKIVLEARELFREKGYVGASMQDLADKVGLRKASLYMRFPNKEALVPEVLSLTLDETFSQPDIEASDWYTAYEAVVRAIADSLMDRKRCVGFHLAYGVGDDTPIAKETVRNFFQSHRDRMTAILEKAMPRDIASITATDALVRLEGATLLLAVFEDRGPMERVVDAVLAAVRQ